MINFTNFSYRPECAEAANDIYHFIKADTTPEDFDKACQIFQNCSLYDKAFVFENKYSNTPFAGAAHHGNIPLIDHIFKLGGKPLLSISVDGITPLHAAIFCEDLEKGYFAAKKLIQFGTPVNIIEKDGDHFTPLEWALIYKKSNIATMLLGIGGIARPLLVIKNALKPAENSLMNLKIFKMSAEKDKNSYLYTLPDDVINTIFSIGW